MRILFFSRLFYPHIGGVEKHVLHLSKELLKRGHTVTIVTEKFKVDLSEHEVVHGIEIYRIPINVSEKEKKYTVWTWLRNNMQLIKNADIIHCHDVFFWYLPFRLLFPRKQVYTTFHGYEGNTIPNWKSKVSHKIAEKLSHRTICVGKFLTKWYGTKPACITYGAVHIPQVTTRKKSEKTHAVFIGRLEEETGILEYLETVRILKKKSHNLSVTVLGDGSLRKNAEKYCSDNKLQVDFKGFVKDVIPHTKQAQYVFTSRYLGILEAFSVKKLVIAQYNNSIKKDYLQITPFSKYMLIGNTPEELAEKILHRDRQEQMIEGAYTWVKKQTWEHLASDYERLWKAK